MMTQHRCIEVRGHLLQMQQHGKRAAARLTREKFGISFSSSSAQRAALCGGEPPARRGKHLSLPEEVERKLEDLCLVLRELNLPVYSCTGS